MNTQVKIFLLIIAILQLIFAFPSFSKTSIDFSELGSLDSENAFSFKTGNDGVLRIHSIGDVNGDGINDLVLVEEGKNLLALYTFYVLYGGTESFGNLMLLPYDSDSSYFRGFRIFLTPPYKREFLYVGSFGDYSNDGKDDMIITVIPLGDEVIPIEAVMLYGKQRDFTTLIMRDAGYIASTEGEYILQWNNYGQISEYSVIRTGDINNDGIDDGLIRIQGSGGGMIYTLFGNERGEIDLEYPPTSKFRLYDKDPTEMLAIESIGDINHDGLVDFAARSSDEWGDLYVLYGRIGGFPDINATDIPNNQGFKIKGGHNDYIAKYNYGPAGDINGDVIDDFIVDINGNVYVIYGKVSGFSDISLDNLTILDGFKVTQSVLNEDDPNEMSAIHVGDINNDGLDDILLHRRNNLKQSEKNSIVFGQKERRLDIDVAAVETILTFQTNTAFDFLRPVKVGDLNGDGVDDLVFKAWAEIHGFYGSKCEQYTDCSSPMPTICFASKGCTCRNKNMLMQEMACVSSCSSGYYQAYDSTCKICPMNCEVCSSTRKCVECLEGYLNQESSCVTSCSDGYLHFGSMCHSISRIIWPVIGGLVGLAIIIIPTVCITRRLKKQSRKQTEKLEFEIELKKALTPGDERGDSYLEQPIEYVDNANNDRHSMYILKEEEKEDNEEAEGINMNDQQQAEYEAQVKRPE